MFYFKMGRALAAEGLVLCKNLFNFGVFWCKRPGIKYSFRSDSHDSESWTDPQTETCIDVRQ